ncbi:hypothetical protein Taro_025209 [Colocasia esculenta]|uniref:CCHC-type domain-containing protein n=1 Tax=Colocasia esculenta TaxID=4460 RepID=A0A843VJV0_COLES|nr:hypothetical protein [Colocasia esculenta]
MAYEINLKREEAEQLIIKQKDVALKAKKSKRQVEVSSEENSSSGDEEEVAKLAQSFRKFLRKSKPLSTTSFKDFKSENKKEDSSRKTKMICYECQGIGHMTTECPVFLKKQNKSKSDFDLSSSKAEEPKKEEFGLMAIEDESPEISDLSVEPKLGIPLGFRQFPHVTVTHPVDLGPQVG